MSDIEEPPSKLSKMEVSAEYLDESLEASQEEWLAEDVLTDDDHMQEQNTTMNTENLSNSNTTNVDTTSNSQDSSAKANMDLENALNSLDSNNEIDKDTKNETKDNLDYDTNATDAGTSDDGNDTDGLLRMLQDDDKKKKLTKSKAKVDKDSSQDTSDDADDYLFEKSKVGRVLSGGKLKVARRAEPEDSDSDESTDEKQTVQNMFRTRNVAAKRTAQTLITDQQKLAIQKYIERRERMNRNAERMNAQRGIKMAPKKEPLNLNKIKIQETSPKKLDGAKTVTTGAKSVTTGAKSIITGAKSLTTGAKSVTTESKSVLTRAKSVAIGAKSVTTESKSVFTRAKSVAIGAKSVTTEPKSVLTRAKSATTGTNSVTTGAKSVATGAKSVATGEKSVSIGSKPVLTGENSVLSVVKSVATTPKPETWIKSSPTPTTPNPLLGARPGPISKDVEQENKDDDTDITDENEFVEEDLGALIGPGSVPDAAANSIEQQNLRIMEPERMDEEIPSDEDSEDGSLYDDELPTSDSDDLEDWFTLDLRAERAGEYIPMLGPNARNILTEEKQRVSSRLDELRKSVVALSESAKQQAEQIRDATNTLNELEAMIRAT